MIIKLPIGEVQRLNRRLKDQYGTIEDKPNFRLVWSEDEREHRWTNCTPEGFTLLHPEVRELPKYKQWIHEKHILERLTVVPAVSGNDLVTTLSYEPLHVFERGNGDPLIPTWHVIAFIITNVQNAIRTQGQYVKYKDPMADKKIALEVQRANIDNLVEELFGNETEMGDSLAYKEGVSYSGIEIPGQKKE